MGALEDISRHSVSKQVAQGVRTAVLNAAQWMTPLVETPCYPLAAAQQMWGIIKSHRAKAAIGERGASHSSYRQPMLTEEYTASPKVIADLKQMYTSAMHQTLVDSRQVAAAHDHMSTCHSSFDNPIFCMFIGSAAIALQEPGGISLTRISGTSPAKCRQDRFTKQVEDNTHAKVKAQPMNAANVIDLENRDNVSMAKRVIASKSGRP